MGTPVVPDGAAIKVTLDAVLADVKANFGDDLNRYDSSMMQPAVQGLITIGFFTLFFAQINELIADLELVKTKLDTIAANTAV